MQQGLAAMRATGAEVFRPSFLALLAEVYGKVGRPAEGLTVVDEGLTVVEKTGESFYQAGLYQLKGDLLLTLSTTNQTAAETHFVKAIDLARQQQAKSLELRAAMSLSRLWQRQGKRAEAHRLLAEIYDWFSEGFDTPDLQEAEVLLAQLG
jgi:predicted ATPase